MASGVVAKKRFRGWRVVKAGMAIQTVQSALMQQAYGSYSVVLRREFGWSATTLSAAFALNRLESGLLGPLHGWALGWFGVKRVMQCGALILATGLMLFSQLHNRRQFFGFYLIMAVGASLCGFLSVVTATVQWFERRRATALALSQSGFAIGGICVPAVVWSLEHFGWRSTSFVSGIIVLVTILPLSFVFEGRPSDVGEYVDGIDPAERARLLELASDEERATITAGQPSFTTREAMRTSAFWLISLGHASALLVVGAVTAHLSLYLTQERGFSLQEAGVLGGALPLVQLVGQVGGGWLGDRYSKRVLTSLAMIGHVGGLLLLAHATSRLMVWAFIPLHGIAWGIRGPLMQAWRADYFGAASFGQIMGVSSLVIMFGQMGGPLLAGRLYDTTGSYTYGFTVIALLASLGMGFFAFAAPPKPLTLTLVT